MELITTPKVFADKVTLEAPVAINAALALTGDLALVGALSDVAGVKAAYDATFTVGAEDATVINIAVQVRDANGDDIAHRHLMYGWISSDSAGNTLEGTPPDAWAIGTDGTLFLSGGDSLVMFHALTEADGDLDINCTQDAADTYYLNFLIGGKVWSSGAITHSGA